MHMVRWSARSRWAAQRLQAIGGPSRLAGGRAAAEVARVGWNTAGEDAWPASTSSGGWFTSAPVFPDGGVPTALPFAAPLADKPPSAPAAAAAAARIAQPWLDRLTPPAQPAAAPAWLHAPAGVPSSPVAWAPAWGIAVLPLLLPATPPPSPCFTLSFPDHAVESAWALSHLRVPVLPAASPRAGGGGRGLGAPPAG
eukprot:scaffold17001_cov84-Isochrysis_galbana.AAC.1